VLAHNAGKKQVGKGKNAECETQASSESIAYRALRQDETPSHGLRGRLPGANTSVGSHVMGKRESDLISLTRDRSLAEGLFNSGNGVVEIDLSKVTGEIIDVSKGFGSGRVFYRTRAHQEILIRDSGGDSPPIPPGAIRFLKKRRR
jgi:hypothetical protein